MKILIIEDDALIAQTLTLILNQQNYAVEVATDGLAGWDLITAFDYDLLILDVMLPKLNGIDLCRRVRSKGLQMPILLLTGRDSGHDKAIGLDAGADDYLVKPFDGEELVARIRALLRRAGNGSAPILSWGSLQLDPSSCEVTYKAQLLPLTPKEYALLELFLRNPRRVFSCSMILEHLWTYEEMPGEEAVRTHIKGLRHKLKAAEVSSDVIETVYGIGYRLKPLPDEQSQAHSASKSGNTGASVKRSAKAGDQPAAVSPKSEHSSSTEKDSANSLVFEAVTSQQTVAGQPPIAPLPNHLADPGSFETATKVAIAQVWHRFQGRVSNQVALIEQAALTLHNALSQQSSVTAQASLPPDLQQQVEQEAHTLAGSLGMFGFWQGSQLARNLEELLKRHQPFTPDEVAQFATWAEALRQEIEQPPTQPASVSGSSPRLDARSPHPESSSELVDPDRPLPQNILEPSRQSLPLTTATILAVDDDPQILEVLQTLLEPWGLHVETLADPQQFWQVLPQIAPDLLILDVKMPQVNGIELCQAIRSDDRWGELPILFLTAYQDVEIVNQVFAVGADDFVSKPIVGPELVTRIVNRLERIKLLRRMASSHPTSVSPPQDPDQHPALPKSHESSLDRDPVQANLLKTKNDLELRVAERTAELIAVNHQLQIELDERRRTQEALRNSEARFAGIVSSADDAIISIDQNQLITLFNKGAERIFGYTAEEIVGQPLLRLIPMRFTATHSQHIHQFGQSIHPSHRLGDRHEFTGRRKDGTEFPAEASLSKLDLSEETVYTVILRDITDRKQIERMKDEFISVVSHELRTPLTSIHGSLGLLASGLLKADSEQGQRLLQIAVESTDRLVRLINDILDIERIESGKVKMEKQACSVVTLLTQAIEGMQAIADQSQITLELHPQIESQVCTWVDSDRIYQTLTNLLSNAIKFSSPGSVVALNAQIQTNPENPRSHQVVISVEDHGRGIPPEKQESIFERFQQVDSSDSRNHDGTGLGLTICRSIVQQHGGKIWVESIPGQGSTFSFTLPLIQPNQPHALPLLQQFAEPRSIPSIPSAPLVLICDDDPAILTLLETLLIQQGYRTHSVSSGKAAIAQAITLQPDAILLDLLMPEMDGWETMATLKQQPETCQIPIIICSICAPLGQHPTDPDFADWIPKPLDERSLFQVLRQVLSQTSGRARILLVEDDPDLAQVLISLFQSHNVETFHAKTGREAIHLSQQIKPDLLILDLVIPEGNGFAVVEWLQQHDQLHNIPLVVYSAQDLDAMERDRLKLGHTEFLPKGQVTPEEFEQRVLKLLQQITSIAHHSPLLHETHPRH
ncbi:MAG: response regulator [Oculatellaceae cyanobacterium Prado106]|jgi:PAS domain S-box-containing protein|nr:response regulator [Oculatellaceae cyanobacterium Prado106]